MRKTPTRTQERDRLLKPDRDLGQAIELGVAKAHQLRAEAFREAVHQAGLGLSQLFGLHRRTAVRLHSADLKRS
jgi:hypothetical protein